MKHERTPIGQPGSGAPALSPDGRWLAYVSDESGRNEVYVRGYPTGGARAQVSTGGGTEPAWTHDGREVLYRSGNAFFAAAVRTAPAPSVERPRRLFAGPYISTRRWREYDVDPRDGRIAVARPAGRETRLVITLHWLAALRARLQEER